MVIFAKKELFEINAFLSWFFRCCGGVCVRGTKDEAFRSHHRINADLLYSISRNKIP